MIRKAKKTDAKLVAPLLYNALHEIAEKITGSTVETEVLLGLETWFSKEENRLSYENCFVYEQDGGGQLELLSLITVVKQQCLMHQLYIT